MSLTEKFVQIFGTEFAILFFPLPLGKGSAWQYDFNEIVQLYNLWFLSFFFFKLKLE